MEKASGAAMMQSTAGATSTRTATLLILFHALSLILQAAITAALPQVCRSDGNSEVQSGRDYYPVWPAAMRKRPEFPGNRRGAGPLWCAFQTWVGHRANRGHDAAGAATKLRCFA
jgi:hypothetical protein